MGAPCREVARSCRDTPVKSGYPIQVSGYLHRGELPADGAPMSAAPNRPSAPPRPNRAAVDADADRPVGVALLGAGVVGSQVVRLLGEHAGDLAARIGGRCDWWAWPCAGPTGTPRSPTIC